MPATSCTSSSRASSVRFPDARPAPAPEFAMNFSNRWVQLVAGITGMVAVANFQYSWTLFEGPLSDRHPTWTKVQIQDALAIFFVSAQTWLVPLEGYLAERFGPRKLLIGGGVLAALGWVVNAHTSSLTIL